MVKYIIYWYKIKSYGITNTGFYVSYKNKLEDKYSFEPLDAKKFDSIISILQHRTNINTSSRGDIEYLLKKINKDKIYSRIKKIDKIYKKNTIIYSPDFWEDLGFRIDKIIFTNTSYNVHRISLNEFEDALKNKYESLNKYYKKIDTIKNEPLNVVIEKLDANDPFWD